MCKQSKGRKMEQRYTPRCITTNNNNNNNKLLETEMRSRKKLRRF